MKSSNLITILMMLLLVLVLRSCNVIDSIPRRSIGIGALVFIAVILLAVVVDKRLKK